MLPWPGLPCLQTSDLKPISSIALQSFADSTGCSQSGNPMAAAGSIFRLDDSLTFASDGDDRRGGVSRVEQMCVFVVFELFRFLATTLFCL